jgi:hypothetical protein
VLIGEFPILCRSVRRFGHSQRFDQTRRTSGGGLIAVAGFDRDCEHIRSARLAEISIKLLIIFYRPVNHCLVLCCDARS